VADAFFVAFRLPNHFRAIFAEGAFNAAFVPAYAHVHGERGANAAGLFANRIFHAPVPVATGLARCRLVVHAAGDQHPRARLRRRREQRRLAIDLTRITFPYLLLITLVTLYGGMLNVMHRFASAAAASIFLNLAMMMTLALVRFSRPPAIAAAWSVLISGFLQYFLLAGDLARHGGLRGLRRSSWMKMFARSFGRLGLRPSARWNAGRLVRRYHHRDLSPRWRAVGAVLRRPPQPVADWRDRDRDSARYCCRKCRAA